MITIAYHPTINRYSIEHPRFPLRRVDYQFARLWLRGHGLTPREIRRLLDLAILAAFL